MKSVLICWVGKTDLRAPKEADAVGLGPIAQGLDSRKFDEAFLLADYPPEEVKIYVRWLEKRTSTKLHVIEQKLSGPTNYGEIYEAAVRVCAAVNERMHGKVKLTFHLSPGTPAMASIWLILAKTRFPADLIESSRDHGVRTVAVPFDLAADFLPDLLRRQDELIGKLSEAAPPETPEFAHLVHQSRVMARLIERARRVALHGVPVLIEGESGTGKELLARAIHRASSRRDRRFVAVNCGAIPENLIESELFGHEKGAFTGAVAAHTGYFEAAHGGSLFLDEIGELPAPAQVKLLRALQEGEFVRVGATKPTKVDVRIIAATNRTLTQEIAASRFREDLFYRVAVAVLNVPPLRDRKGDLGLLIDHLLEQLAQEKGAHPGLSQKKLSAGARNLLLTHPWPGNVRELVNTLRRIAIWSDGESITAEDVREAILPTAGTRTEILNRPLGEGFSLPDLIGEVARHYLDRAMDEAGKNKTKAAELVGLPSYQTLSNWLRRHEVDV